MPVNTTPIPAGSALEALEAGWRAQAAGALTVSWMLHGRPGVGKTEIVATLADRIGARLHDLRLTTIEPADLRGLPYYDHEALRTRWYRPEDLPESAEPAILFLDELTAAPPTLQPTVYGLLQERRVGRHLLPPSVMVIAAGNDVEDGAIAYEMGTALSDRLIHLQIVATAPDWLENFALPRRLHPAVTAFIRTRPDLLETTEASLRDGRTIAATPRSWERVSRIMRAIPERRLRATLIAGTVGEAVAAEFAIVADDIATTVRVGEMLALGRRARLPLYPASMHGLTALVHGLVGALDEGSAPAAIDILADIPTLAEARSEPEFRRLPLAELATYGFEILIRRGLDLGLGEVFLASPAWRAYQAEREALGLA
jgi:MoxR-like ATPase